MSLSHRLEKLEAKAAAPPPPAEPKADLSRLTPRERAFLESLDDDLSRLSDAELGEATRLLSCATPPTATGGHGSPAMAAGCDCGACEAAKRYMERSNELTPTPAEPEGMK